MNRLLLFLSPVIFSPSSASSSSSFLFPIAWLILSTSQSNKREYNIFANESRLCFASETLKGFKIAPSAVTICLEISAFSKRSLFTFKTDAASSKLRFAFEATTDASSSSGEGEKSILPKCNTPETTPNTSSLSDSEIPTTSMAFWVSSYPTTSEIRSNFTHFD